ncbi:hypothetical protein D3C81_2244020 [compost metagenome]
MHQVLHVDSGVWRRLDQPQQTFAEFRIRHAEHGAIGHARVLGQVVFDFGGIDVHAARDHQV